MDAGAVLERSWTQQLILLFLLVLAAGNQLTSRRGGSRNILTGAARLRAGAMVGPAAMTTGGWRRASGEPACSIDGGRSVRQDLFQTICAQATGGHVGSWYWARWQCWWQRFSTATCNSLCCCNRLPEFQRQLAMATPCCRNRSPFNGNLHEAALTTMRMDGAPAERYVH